MIKQASQAQVVKENIFYGLVLFAAVSSIIFLFGIIISLVSQSFQAFAEIGLFKLLFGIEWYPTHEPPDFGILPLIAGSFLITALTLVIAVPFGVGSALYVAEVAKPKEKELLKPFIELLASIPSVIYGLFGMELLAPWMQRTFGLRSGFNAFSASIILGVMVIPIISSISEDAFTSVPKSLREASLGLGANKWETITRVVLPAAKSGVITSVILGIGRAIGETMVVLMIAGNSAIMPTSIFDSVRPMTSTIAAEMGETPIGSLHYKTLIAIGVVLFIMTFILNMITVNIKERIKKQHRE
ncbi:MAG: phosphate ABC transporter permease subunit PstC [Spirochaetes bacterium]|nr:phosphate ABC transporter permease subunit PstC [Spirochaetota bacterium]